jgi:hypothetical protein
LLWKPVNKFVGEEDSGFDDMIGGTAIVNGDALGCGRTGQVKWSGTIMKCNLQSEVDSLQKIEPGSEVTIKEVSKGILLPATEPFLPSKFPILWIHRLGTRYKFSSMLRQSARAI